MNPTLKVFLINATKHAVNAVFVNSALMLRWSSVFHLHSWTGFLNLLQATGIVILAREASVYLPRLASWSNTPTDGGQK